MRQIPKDEFDDFTFHVSGEKLGTLQISKSMAINSTLFLYSLTIALILPGW